MPVWFSCFVAVAAVALSTACSLKTDTEIATEVAEEWTRQSAEEIGDVLGPAVTGGIPGVSQLAEALIANQIRQLVQWDLDEPVLLEEQSYRVDATASVPLSIDIVIGSWSADLTASFRLVVDTEAERVDDWSLIPGSIALANQSGGFGGEGGVGDVVEGIRRLFD